jgi:hypothetical protein
VTFKEKFEEKAECIRQKKNLEEEEECIIIIIIIIMRMRDVGS